MAKCRIGVALKATPLLIVFLATLLAPVMRAEATVIRDLRIGDNNEYVRMVLEFDRPLNPSPSFSIYRNTLQITLIVVTSIIAVLLIFLICMGAGRKNPPEPSWVYDLPSTRDRDIESIDAVIDDQLKNQNHQ